MNIPEFIYYCIERHLNFFQVFVLTNKTAVKDLHLPSVYMYERVSLTRIRIAVINKMHIQQCPPYSWKGEYITRPPVGA